MEKIGVGYAYISDKEKKYVNEALDAGRLSQGDMVNRFEREFANLHEQKYGIACNSGTSALHVAPAITFIATPNACLHAGLKPVFVDVDAKTYNMDPMRIEKRISEKTVAIMPVHTFGQPCEMDAIVEIAKRYNLRIIEDGAEAHFATYKGKKVGSFGDIAGFSTYVAHTITTGIGGIITTNRQDLSEISRSLIAHGRACTCEKCIASDPRQVCKVRMQTEIDKRFMMVRLGYSYRIGEIEGAIGLGQLENRDIIMNTRKENAAYLTKNLQNAREFLQLPYYPDYVDHSFMMYPLVVKKDAPFTRDDITHFLESENIETRPMLPLLNQPVYQELFGNIEDEYPVSKWVNHNGFYIGCHHGLCQEHLDKIITEIYTFLKSQ